MCVFSHGLVITLGVTLSDEYSCDCDEDSLVLCDENIVEACIGECIYNADIFSIAKTLDESWIDPMFFEFSGMDLFKSVRFGSM